MTYTTIYIYINSFTSVDFVMEIGRLETLL